MTNTPSFPREIAPGIHWLGVCLGSESGGRKFHVHLGAFLLMGKDKTLLVDTTTPQYWDEFSKQLDTVLDGRKLDLIMPTHPEVAHCANLSYLMRKFPESRIIGDMRDYHLFFPEYMHRTIEKKVGEEIDLGGLQFVFIDAFIKDLPSTMWGFERSSRTMFVSDGFSFTHDVPDDLEDDEALHLPGQCAMTSSEMVHGINSDQASYLLRAALYWSRFIEADVLFEEVDQLLEHYSPRIMAPGHGNVIDNLDEVVPIIRQVHDRAFKTGGAVAAAEASFVNPTAQG